MDRRHFLSTPALALAGAAPVSASDAAGIGRPARLFCPASLDLMEKRRDSPRVSKKHPSRLTGLCVPPLRDSEATFEGPDHPRVDPKLIGNFRTARIAAADEGRMSGGDARRLFRL